MQVRKRARECESVTARVLGVEGPTLRIRLFSSSLGLSPYVIAEKMHNIS